MAYASYEFYQSNYKGTEIPPESWDKLSLIADSIINAFTFNRLLNLDTVPQNALMACCCVAEVLYTHNAETSRRFAEVKAENTDGYSVTIESSQDLQKRRTYEIARAMDIFLPPSHPLRYLGVLPCL